MVLSFSRFERFWHSRSAKAGPSGREQVLRERPNGFSFARLHDARIVETKGHQAMWSFDRPIAVDENTIFEAAPLAKPVFA